MSKVSPLSPIISEMRRWYEILFFLIQVQ
jgi:hypothetical protein